MPLYDLSTDEGHASYRAFLQTRMKTMRLDDLSTLDGLKARARDLDYAIVGDTMFSDEGYRDGDVTTMFAQMVDWLASANFAEGQRIGMGDLHKAAVAGFAEEPPEKVFHKTMFWLAGDWANLLDVQFVYRDDAGAEFVLGSRVSELLDGKQFVHPKTGVPDPDADKKTFVYFSPTDKLMALRTNIDRPCP